MFGQVSCRISKNQTLTSWFEANVSNQGTLNTGMSAPPSHPHFLQVGTKTIFFGAKIHQVGAILEKSL